MDLRATSASSSDDVVPLRPAVFFDRDGTLIEDVHYLSDPRELRLIPGAVDGLRRLRNAGYACVIVTNQSAIGRGLITTDDLERIHEEMERLMRQEGAFLDGIYFCPLSPEQNDDREPSERKPGPGMLIRAARELGLDLARSWMVGDKISDVAAGQRAGCVASIGVRTGKGCEGDASILHQPFPLVDDIRAAVDLILSAGAEARSQPSGATPFDVEPAIFGSF
jgi:D-glycero-D-manno-heptose 1,7-bisphosphate phosphatase